MPNFGLQIIANMDRNATHFVVPVGSSLWWVMNLGLLLSVLLVLGLTRRAQAELRQRVAKAIAALMLANFTVNQCVLWVEGRWDIQTSLPLHLCSMSVLLSAYMLWTRQAFAYELALFWGAGAVHSFITPESTTGGGVYDLWEYSISHGGIILAGLFATMRLGMAPRPKSWWRAFLFTQLTVPIIGLVNYLLDSNYMYLAQKPNADNPMIIGEWPWYILALEAVVLVHFGLFYLLHSWLAKRSH
jgi:hypothetical integral membrane protein (TIGR02206 family)